MAFKARSAGARNSGSRDFSIVGDEQERHRIQLEHNLQQINNLSLHLSSSKDDYSIEYPRHANHHSPRPDFSSFRHHSVDNLDQEDQSHTHHWSYRTLDDDGENGIYPYAAGSLSTAAHHASALTFTAGLANRREHTQSGAEYDPDRPLHNIIAGVDSRLSMFGNTQSKSNNAISTQLFDPLVVDDSAQLDRVLNTGRAPPHVLSTDLRSPLASSSSSSSSVSSSKPSRPKLSDALHHVAFSPKRPRSAQSFVSPRLSKHSLPRPSSPSPGKVSFDVPTPRVRSKTQSYPHVNVQPPTPSSVNSKFTRMARGLAREIEMEQGRATKANDEDMAVAHYMSRDRAKIKGRRVIGKPSPKGRVYLPDITGLTSAVESPAKGRLDYHRYEGRDDRESEARILATLSIVQSKLAFLESENGLSRRRVKELELELEACKRDVARERTRILAMELEEVERQHAPSSKERKGKAKEYPEREELSRYYEAVEEKKALEALISTLRSHLTRLTSELSSHQSLLTELRSLRDADAKTLQSKSDEVNMLRDQVEQLAGEVEVLKGVVEEGLKERRMVREQSIASYDGGGSANSNEPQVQVKDNPQTEEQSTHKGNPHSPGPWSHHVPGDKTMRTDYATVGSSQRAGPSSKMFINSNEVERISFELDERRSTRSTSPSAASSLSSHNQSLSYAQTHLHSRPPSASANHSFSASQNEIQSNISNQESSEAGDRPPPSIATSSERVDRPSAPTPTHVPGHDKPSGSGFARKQKTSDDELATPFPQIRGERLERLFFSAPEHNVRTCNVCQRKCHHNDLRRTSWLPSRFVAGFTTKHQHQQPSDVDEGYDEGNEEHEHRVDGKGKGREVTDIATHMRQTGSRNKLPPQTVLARVLREIEDDFTHYKGIYVELSDQYKLMDAASNVAKRNVLAEHLRETIDILEQKGDQIASLYDLLTFEDRPIQHPVDKAGSIPA